MIVRYNKLKIVIGAGEAKPGGIIGATLSPYLFSANMNDFCKKFNELTQIYEVGFPVNVVIHCDVVEKQYSFFLKKPSLLIFIRKLRKDLRFKRRLVNFLEIYDLILYFSENFFVNIISAALYFFGILRVRTIVGRINFTPLFAKFENFL